MNPWVFQVPGSLTFESQVKPVSILVTILFFVTSF